MNVIYTYQMLSLNERVQEIERKNNLLEIKASQLTNQMRGLKVSYVSWINEQEAKKRAFISSLKL